MSEPQKENGALESTQASRGPAPVPTQEQASNLAAPLDERDQALIAALTADRRDYRAEAQDQSLRERERHWLRRLFKRLDHGRWRDAKNKYVAYGIAIIGVLVLWNYWPRPNLRSASVPHPTVFPVAQAGVSPTGSLKPSAVGPALSITPSPKRLASPRIQVSRPPMAPPPSLENPIPLAPAPLRRAAPIPLYAPPAQVRNGTGLRASGSGDAPGGDFAPPVIPSGLEAPSGDALTFRTPIEARAASLATPAAPAPVLERQPAVASGSDVLADDSGILVNRATREGEASTSANRRPGDPSDAALEAIPPLLDRGGSSAAVPAAESPYPPGTKLSATLLTGVVAVAGNQDFPVVARLEDGGIAFGKATLDGSLRVRLRFLEVVREGRSSPVSAQALDPQGYPGLAGEVGDQAPSVVNDLLRAAVGGVSSYVENLAHSGTTTIGTGATTVTNAVPGLGWSILGNIANLFQVPTDGRALVRVVELKPDAPLTVLFMPPAR